jgi:hypothetical protein
MFETLRCKNPVSASDAKQGATFHYIRANLVLKGIVENGFCLHGVENAELEAFMGPNPGDEVNTESAYLESAAKKLDIVTANWTRLL